MSSLRGGRYLVRSATSSNAVTFSCQFQDRSRWQVTWRRSSYWPLDSYPLTTELFEINQHNDPLRNWRTSCSWYFESNLFEWKSNFNGDESNWMEIKFIDTYSQSFNYHMVLLVVIIVLQNCFFPNPIMQKKKPNNFSVSYIALMITSSTIDFLVIFHHLHVITQSCTNGVTQCSITVVLRRRFPARENKFPDRKFHSANMGPTWVLPAPGGPHIGQLNLAIWVV